MIKRGKKGISPVVSTVLLIMIVIILAAIILLWLLAFHNEAVLKDIAGNKKNIEQYCGEVSIKRIIEENDFGFVNQGNVPIYKVKLKTLSQGSSETKVIDEQVDEGESVFFGKDYDDYEKVEIIPILVGKTDDGDYQEYECPETYTKVI